MTTRQAGLKMRPMPPLGGSIVVRAVVINTYFADQEIRNGRAGAEVESRGISCDVFTYGGAHRHFLPRVAVAQERHSINDHDLWIPRGTKIDLATGLAPVYNRQADNSAKAGDPRDFDGDHVLVTFLENSPTQGIIFKAIPHPRSTFRPVAADGDRRRVQFRGVSAEIDTLGNVVVDATRANDGEGLAAGPNAAVPGAETPADGRPITDLEKAVFGNVSVRMARNSTLTVTGASPDGSDPKFSLTLKDGEMHLQLNDGESLKVAGKDNATILTVGDGGKHVAVVEHLQALYESLKAQLDIFATHAHPDGFGSTAPAVPTLVTPSWDSAINSTHVKIPDT